MSEITKKALAETLKKLLSKNKLNKITIKEITEDCGVNNLCNLATRIFIYI